MWSNSTLTALGNKIVHFISCINKATAVFQGDSASMTNDAHDLLLGDQESASGLSFKPMGRNSFKYKKPEGETQDWRADGNRWIYQRTYTSPQEKPFDTKTYFYIQAETGAITKSFIRIIFYFPIKKPSGPFLIQYIGDSSVSKVFS